MLEELAAQKIPVVMECMKEKGCELSPITFNWLMTIFIDSVPVEVSVTDGSFVTLVSQKLA